jgi:diaminopimelate epimerase
MNERARIEFYKYHALGNDYLVLPGTDGSQLAPETIRRICDRHFGLGSDGLLLPVGRDSEGRFLLRIFNPDGSEAEKSGNGLRIFARFLWDQRDVGVEPFAVVTKGGLVRCEVRDQGRSVFVEMGQASFNSAQIPVAGAAREVVNELLQVLGENLRITAVTIGNPHCVAFMTKISRALVEKLGPAVERHTLFPNRTNVQLAQVVTRNHLRIEIWERGAGYTLASGSSSCAAAAAAVRLGLCDSPITVEMPGGSLAVQVAEDFTVTMLGPVTRVAEGDLDGECFDWPPR